MSADSADATPPEPSETPGLFSPFTVRDVTLRNRIVMAPMLQYAAEEGVAGPWHLVHLGARAIGGAGLVMVEPTAVLADGRATVGDLGLWREAQAKALAPVARFISEQGSVPGIQLSHAGRKGSMRRPWEKEAPLSQPEGGWETVAPSAIPHDESRLVPRQLVKKDMNAIASAFGKAALRARNAGFRWLELHAGDGYLLHQFLSPIANRRRDDFGGSFLNQSRFLIDVVRAVRQSWDPTLPLGLKLSVTDGVDGGLVAADAVQLVKLVKTEGIDYVTCSAGGISRDAPAVVRGEDHADLAGVVRERARIVTGAVGGISEPQQAQEIVAAGHADLVFLGRALLREPSFPVRAAEALGVDPPLPRAYELARR